MPINDNSTNKSIHPNKEDIIMSTDKTSITPSSIHASNNQTPGELMQTSDTAPDTQHHQYYTFGTAQEEWIPTEYQQPWIWHSPKDLPVSPEFHGYWEKLPSEKKISEENLEYFKMHAIPITKEEYDRLLKIKKDIQHADDDMEYRWYGPRYDDDE